MGSDNNPSGRKIIDFHNKGKKDPRTHGNIIRFFSSDALREELREAGRRSPEDPSDLELTVEAYEETSLKAKANDGAHGYSITALKDQIGKRFDKICLISDYKGKDYMYKLEREDDGSKDMSSSRFMNTIRYGNILSGITTRGDGDMPWIMSKGKFPGEFEQIFSDAQYKIASIRSALIDSGYIIAEDLPRIGYDN